MAFSDARGLAFSKKIVEGKIKNQEKLLRYFGKYLKESDPARFEKIEQAAGRLREIRARVEPVQGQALRRSAGPSWGWRGMPAASTGRRSKRSSARSSSSSAASTGGPPTR